MQAINTPLQEFLTWKRTIESTQQSPELKLIVVLKMQELLEQCTTIMKRFEQDVRAENIKQK